LDKSAVPMAYPLRIVHGIVPRANRPDHVRQMIEQVLFTMPGERVMYPDLGVGVERLVFSATGIEMTAAAQSLIASSLQRWLGDVISVQDVRVTTVDSTLSVEILYELTETHEVRRDRFER
jgi:phage baseplate assembly protein W